MEVAGKVSENIEIISSKLQDMEGAGKGSECGKVRVHRNIKSKSVSKTWRAGKGSEYGKDQSASKFKVKIG